jgi:hypothetical protein
MPKARLPIHSKTTGPEQIGAALEERWHEINRHAIETAKARLDAAFNSIAQPIIDAAYAEGLSDQERISHDEKRKLAVALRLRIGQPVVQIDILCREIWMHEQEATLRAMERQEELPEYSFGRPMTNDARGRRLQQAVEMCAACLRTSPNPDDVPHGPVVVRLASICFEQILCELRRLKILGICRYCGKTIFPAITTKLYCSPRYEGRDCSHRQSSKTYDAKRRTPKS